MLQPTITVGPVEGLPVIHMSWRDPVESEVVRRAFEQVSDYLKLAAFPNHLVVDVGDNPDIPMMTALNCALLGPFEQPNMGACLIVGGSVLARLLAGTLRDVSRRRDIFWYPDIRQADGQLKRLVDAVRISYAS